MNQPCPRCLTEKKLWNACHSCGLDTTDIPQRVQVATDLMEATRQRDQALKERNKARAARDQALNERDEARKTLIQVHNHLTEVGVPIIELDLAERIEWLADKRNQALKELATEAAKVCLLQDSLKYTPEPSRLEIAARIMQGWAANPRFFDLHGYGASALRNADALIAAAKEVAK